MSKRSIPSLSALQAFDAAARLLSFTRAAEELFLTQSAVSRQIQALEDALGTPLFQRIGNRLALTDAARGYHDEISPLLQALRAATLNLMAFKGAGGTLRLAVLPTMGMKWLVPRLPRFIEAHPEIQVDLSTRSRPVDWSSEEFDAAVQHGAPRWSGVTGMRILNEQLVVVASPDLIGHRAGMDELVKLPLIQQVTRPEAWATWFPSFGRAHPDPYAGARFEQFSHVIQAAIAGLGLALVPWFLVEDETRAGKLILAWPDPVDGPDAYYLVYPERKAEDPAVQAFRTWLHAQASAFEREARAARPAGKRKS